MTKVKLVFILVVFAAVLASGFADPAVTRPPITSFDADNFGDYLQIGNFMGGGHYGSITYQFNVINKSRFDLKDISIHIVSKAGSETIEISYLPKKDTVKKSVTFYDYEASPTDGVLSRFGIEKVSAKGVIVR